MWCRLENWCNFSSTPSHKLNDTYSNHVRLDPKGNLLQVTKLPSRLQLKAQKLRATK